MAMTEKELKNHLKEGWKIIYDKSLGRYKLWKWDKKEKRIKFIYIPNSLQNIAEKIWQTKADKEEKIKEEYVEKKGGGKAEVIEEENKKEEEYILPYPPTVKPPEEFFREFIEHYPVKKEFVKIYCERIKRRKELPHPTDLAADLADMQSGINNARAIQFIADEYSYALNDYLREVGETQNITHSSYGIKVAPQNTWRTSFTYTPPPYTPSPPIYTPPPPPSQYSYQHSYHNPQSKNDDGSVLTMKDFLLWQKEQEIKQREQELNRLKEELTKPHTDETLNFFKERILQLEEKLRKRDEERIKQLEEELKYTRERKSISEQDIQRVVRRILEEKEKKLTPEDIKRIIKEELSTIRPRSKEDLDYLLARDKLKLEERKLEEKGKTRETIAEAIKTGFSQIGVALFKTLTEPSTGKTTTVKGYTDATKTLWQVPCPSCGALITAPIGSTLLTCPNCGRKYEIQKPTPEIPKTMEKPKPPMENKCPICGKTFKSEKAVRMHMLGAHRKRKKKKGDD